MKKKHILAICIALFLLYGGIYCALRLTKYFVRQDFLTYASHSRIRDMYPTDHGPITNGYTSYSFESQRNQIGCGRIQKKSTRFGETFLAPLFSPMGEMEMRIRGFNIAKMQILKSVAEFERYNSSSNRVYFHRQSLVDEIVVSRNEQKF